MLHARLRAAAGRDRIPTDGLVAWYTMDNISGSTLVDEQGSYNGTITGATQAAGIIGQALDFDGTDDSVSISSSVIDLSSDFTVSAWCNKRNNATDNDRLFSFIDSSSNNFQFIFDDSTQKMGVRLTRGGSNVVNQRVYSSIDFGEWVLHTFVISGTSPTVYRNDAESLDSGSTAIGVAGTGYFVGKRSDSNFTTFYDGLLDQVRIYNRALTQSEVSAIYNEGS